MVGLCAIHLFPLTRLWRQCSLASTQIGLFFLGCRLAQCTVPEQLAGSPALSPCLINPGFFLSLSATSSSRNDPILNSDGT